MIPILPDPLQLGLDFQRIASLEFDFRVYERIDNELAENQSREGTGSGSAEWMNPRYDASSGLSSECCIWIVCRYMHLPWKTPVNSQSNLIHMIESGTLSICCGLHSLRPLF